MRATYKQPAVCRVACHYRRRILQHGINPRSPGYGKQFQNLLANSGINPRSPGCGKQFQKLLANYGLSKFTISRRNYAKNSEVTLNNAFKLYNLDEGPSTNASLTRDDALRMVRHMHEIRRVETESANLYKSKHIRGFCHLYIGQEAIAIGMKEAMRAQDSLITSYRCHAWTVLMGVSYAAMLGELMGLSKGCSRGKGGSMHMYAKNFYGGNGIVGAQVPLGAGVALAHKYKNDGGVNFALYGDGAANQGQVFESFNMSCLWQLPVVFVCENNVYAMGTKVDRGACSIDYYSRGHFIPGLWVDGNQVLAVRSATKFAIEYALKHGPIVMEMYTYRYMGHSMSDPGTSYRTRDEIADVRKTRDPITTFQNQVIELGLAKEDELKEIAKKARSKIAEAVKVAKADKEVPLSEISADIFVKCYEPSIRNTTGYNLKHMNTTKIAEAAPKPTPADQLNKPPKKNSPSKAKPTKSSSGGGKSKGKSKKSSKSKDDDDDDDDC